ncbi:carboxypeptidase-like regulatory domain-containing protein [Fodinibius halophilus]|uniref:Carboxypeptidase-like regulatory domain-containing protein n=1 Tax=Fodinibius halophilus TaxID=1736908 RepID=A0A6M1T9Z9_9BACT|nr:carboxypeptidase-like regulatory domain-containing protein [Fodinibius halophilus]NGP87202.1 carboxypeptidase-like regulatory domain-containing protein [Fodinibius halophilus]
MKLKRSILFFFQVMAILVFFPLMVHAQFTIKGYVTDSEGDELGGATVVLKDSINNIIDYDITTSGNFKIQGTDYDGTSLLNVRFLGYQPIVDTLKIHENLAITKKYVLQDSSYSLNEVKVTEEISWEVSQKGDTTSYNVSGFIDGTEHVVEDVLKKLPGFQVTDKGNVLFKGENIKKILIEGGDLFGESYKIPSKNIKAGTIENIEAIENYLDNEKLKGIKDSDLTIVNLQLKDKSLFNPSLNNSLKYGYSDYYDIESDFIMTGRILKNFTVVNGNSIGEKGVITSGHNIPTEGILPQKVDAIIFESPIRKTSIFSDIEKRRMNDNSVWSGSFNNLIKLDDKSKARVKYSFLSGKNKFHENTQKNYLLNQNSFSVNEERKLIQKPFKHVGQLYIDYNVFKNGKIRMNNIFNISSGSRIRSINSNIYTYTEDLSNNNLEYSTNLEYTHRLTSKSALIARASYLFSSHDQSFELRNSDLSNSLTQENGIGHDYINISGKYLLSLGSDEFSISGKYTNRKRDFSSTITEGKLTDTLSVGNYINNISSVDETTAIKGEYEYNINSWKFDFNLGYVSKRFNSLDDRNDLRNNIQYLEPILSFRKRFLDSQAEWAFNYSYKKDFIDIGEVYPNNILLDYRTLGKGLNKVSIVSKHTLLGILSYSDIFDKLITASLSLFHSSHDKAIGSISIYEPAINNISKVYTPGNKNTNIGLSIDKYVDVLRGTFVITSNFSWFEYYNYINDLALRHNLASSSKYSLTYRTDWDTPVDLEVGINYRISKYASDKTSDINSSSIFPLLEIVYKPTSKFLISIDSKSYQYFSNSSNKIDSMILIDSLLEYKYLKNKLSFSVKGSNLLGQNKFKQQINGYYYTSVTSRKVRSTSILFGVEFSF